MISKSGSNEEAMVSEMTLCFLYSTICFDKRIDEAGRVMSRRQLEASPIAQLVRAPH